MLVILSFGKTLRALLMTQNCLFSACGRYSCIRRPGIAAVEMPSASSVSKTVVFGANLVGKTSIIEQVVFGVYQPGKTSPTVEDTYEAWVEVDRCQKERIRIYDTAGLNIDSPKVPSHYLHIADGFILVFSVCCQRSFKLVEDLKKEIDRVRGKDFPILVLGTKVDKHDDRKCDHERLMKWADAEKVKLFEVLASNRKTLQEPFTWLVKKMSTSAGKSSSQADIKKIFRKSANKNKDNGGEP